jgi:MFS family permease
VFTLAAAASPSYWWFVAIFALGRPLLSATNGVAQVSVAELTGAKDRAKAVALVAAGYAVGAGVLAITHSLGEGTLGFRGLFALVAVPLFLLPLIGRRVVETDRFSSLVREVRAPIFARVPRQYRRRLVTVTGLTFAIAIMTGPANSFVFFYAQNVRHLSGAVTAAMVAAGGVTGLIGLLSGRWLADHWGRRPTVALSMGCISGFAILTYSGSKVALLAGYGLGVFAGSLFAPAGGALANEVFPTSIRASVAGWYVTAAVLGAVVGLLVFGAVADIGNRFSVAAVVTFIPALPLAALLLLLPETKGTEPEQLWDAA